MANLVISYLPCWPVSLYGFVQKVVLCFFFFFEASALNNVY